MLKHVSVFSGEKNQIYGSLELEIHLAIHVCRTLTKNYTCCLCNVFPAIVIEHINMQVPKILYVEKCVGI